MSDLWENDEPIYRHVLVDMEELYYAFDWLELYANQESLEFLECAEALIDDSIWR